MANRIKGIQGILDFLGFGKADETRDVTKRLKKLVSLMKLQNQVSLKNKAR